MRSRVKGKAMYPITNKQQGSVLLWGLIILIVMTVIGVAATRMANVDNRIAGNQMMYMLTVQGADSRLRESISLYHIMQTATRGTIPTTYDKQAVRELKLDGKTESVSGVHTLGISHLSEDQSCPPLKNMAISTEMVADVGGVTCRIYTAQIDANLSGTGARSQHAEGVLRPTPHVN